MSDSELIQFLQRDDVCIGHLGSIVTVYHKYRKWEGSGHNVIEAARIAANNRGAYNRVTSMEIVDQMAFRIGHSIIIQDGKTILIHTQSSVAANHLKDLIIRTKTVGTNTDD
jgi:hypothetical protein